MDNKIFGQFVAKLRTEKGLTQAKLAEQLHVTNKAVSKWETGKGFPDIQLLEPLAEALGITVMELVRCERQTEPLDEQQTGKVVISAMQDSAGRTSTRIFRVLKWVLLIAGIVVGFFGWCFPALVLQWSLGTLTSKESASIGIIGGADGPTAILISGADTNFWWLLPVFLIIGAIICWILERRSKKK